MRKTSIVTTLSTTLVLVAGLAWADTPRKDLQILNDVAREVRRYSSYTIFDDINVRVEGGTVTLGGKVTMPHKAKDLERLTTRVAGVRTVENQIEVLPVSTFDDELRYRIARAIYGNASFWHYAAMVNPPIHIVVERGHVTLTGTVGTNVERALARSLASVFGALSVTNALHTDAEVTARLERM